MMQQLCSDITLHPASHSCTTEMSEYCFKLGRIWPALASGGKDGQSRLHSCGDDIVDPSGIMTETGLFVGRIFLTFAVVAIKFPGVPESSIL